MHSRCINHSLTLLKKNFMSIIVSPSLLSCDFANIQRDVEMLNNSACDWLHIDVMDGSFVPNISFGFPVIEAMKRHATKPLDVHLMIQNPEKYLRDFKNAGADWLTVHFEACNHLHRVIQEIKELGMKAGVAINPHTPVEWLEDIVADLDLVLVMSVNPGFGGQKFIPNAARKVEKLVSLIEQKGANCEIEVDGGVNLQTGAELVKAGATALVAGSFVFQSQNPGQTIQDLKKLGEW